MKAHTTVMFSQNFLTGKIDLITYFGHSKREPRVTPTVWQTKEAAEKYLYSEQRDWLIQCLEDFIMHKKHIIQASNDTECKTALQHCINFYDEIHSKSLALETICQRVMKGANSFEKIVPNSNNGSYQTSVRNLTEITSFCRLILTTKQP